jgi:hypothetical protein
VTEVRSIHQPVVVNGRHRKDRPDFGWINIVISNLKTSFSGTFHVERIIDSVNEYTCLLSQLEYFVNE